MHNRNAALAALLLGFAATLLTSCAGAGRGSAAWVEQTADARMTMGTILHACRFYREDYQKDAVSVLELEEKEYLSLDDGTKERYDFALILENGALTHIRAVSTAAFVGGPGWELVMDVRTGRFSGALAK